MSVSLFLTCFFIYIVAMIAIGWFAAGNKQTGDDYLLGGRSVPLFLTLGTTLATMVGTGSSMGAVGKAYQDGWMGGLYGIGGGIGILLVAWMFAPAREHRFMTMSEELSSYVGANRAVMNLVAMFVYLSNVGWLGAHIVGGGLYLNFVTGIDLLWAKTLIAIGFGVYSVIGGYRAVVWTDTIQAVVLFIGFALTAVFAYQSVGGIAGMQEVHATQLAQGGGMRLVPAISLVVVIAVGQLGSSANRQRVYSGKSTRTIRTAFVSSGILYLLFSLMPAVIGIAAFEANPELKDPDHAFPWMATEMLPLAVGVLVLLAGLSASMSSASSDVITAVTVVIRELYQMVFRSLPAADRVVFVSRWAVTVTTLLGLAMALAATDIIGYIKDMVALFVAGMAVCGVLGRFWRRFNAVGAIATLCAASATALAFKFMPGETEWWGGSVIPALAVSTLSGIFASLLSPPDERTYQESVEYLARERDQMSA
jgi:SSS family solute:Na+ symporter